MTNFWKILWAAALGIALCTFGSPVFATELTVGGKDFTEQYLMAEMTTQLLETKGYKVDKKDGMGTSIVRAALESGEVDLYWEYTGTSLVTFNKITAMMTSEESYAKVKELDGAKGLVWLSPSKVNDTYALAVREGNPHTSGIKTLSDLAAAYKAGKPLGMSAPAEFTRRQDGLIGLQKAYGFEAGIANVRPMDSGLVYAALANGNVDVAVCTTTDGRVEAMHLSLLKDDKHFFPNYVMVPVVRQATLQAHPDLRGILDSLSSKLDDATMQHLDGQVDVKKISVHDVARSFLKEKGLI
ncbi:Osmoprotectant-binding protein OsmX [Paraburkholderia domus]|uniref:glycine betaine ABC transporter substrate-binding protein n=1 Tax=Paraburkholderia domus TaxID=2793075 RepID=UPI001911AC8D|nr:glycine betaine ABC transporter substrate-binding protein [Paraburkholderia domus]MBK5091557.1 glycine betaine ABC transporter substrate-binding protein [Burkholderia sp. R-69927]CAE6937336.1 Osmoprotectant-binding protein OsmX [Paraburkholderia domus]